MIFVLTIILILVFNSVKIAGENKFIDDYMSREKTSAIKGIFVILIFLSHYSGYVVLEGQYDIPYLLLQNYLHQMVVVMFWFYSGYGIMESISAKGYTYVQKIMSKRFVTVLVNFDLAVLLYACVAIIVGRKIGALEFLLSLIGWRAIGNSNWYIFVTLVLYIIVFLSFINLKWSKNKYIGAAFVTILSILFIYIMMKMGQPTRYYNTTIIFSLGMWYSIFRKHVENILMKKDSYYALFCVGLVCAYFGAYFNRWEYGIEGYTAWAVLFTILIVVFTMKISICNNLLNWFGNHIFSIYILQRIPMILLAQTSLDENHKYVFLILTVLITILMAIVFDSVTSKMWKKIYK